MVSFLSAAPSRSKNYRRPASDGIIARQCKNSYLPDPGARLVFQHFPRPRHARWQGDSPCLWNDHSGDENLNSCGRLAGREVWMILDQPFANASRFACNAYPVCSGTASARHAMSDRYHKRSQRPIAMSGVVIDSRAVAGCEKLHRIMRLASRSGSSQKHSAGYRVACWVEGSGDSP